jgi:hypothetical protein
MIPEHQGRGVDKDALDDSWFRWQKPITTRPPPQPKPIEDEESIDDVADAWFK